MKKKKIKKETSESKEYTSDILKKIKFYLYVCIYSLLHCKYLIHCIVLYSKSTTEFAYLR